VGDLLETSVVDQRCQIDPELALGRSHDADPSELASQRIERVPIGAVRHHVPDGDAALGLLEGEVTEVGEDQCQLLPVIRPPRGLPGTLDEYDAEFAGILAGERADPVGQLVRGHEQPTPAVRRRLAGGERTGEDTHGRSPGATVRPRCILPGRGIFRHPRQTVAPCVTG
jgi:hypothetical protein